MNTRTKPQIIYHDGEPAFAVIPWEEYRRLAPEAPVDEGDMSDEELFDRAKAADEEEFPAAVVDRLLAGVHPLKVFRKHRGLTQQQLAARAGVGTLYISQIETRHRTGSVETLRRLAGALGLDIDDLVEDRPAEPDDDSR
ncbi:MAG: helix-turn-helix transcriptional regulator [Rhodospirillales bacterium]|nr:helix-turn-helix transcriptional regulator [Rhodospirillales bacterium]